MTRSFPTRRSSDLAYTCDGAGAPRSGVEVRSAASPSGAEAGVPSSAGRASRTDAVARADARTGNRRSARSTRAADPGARRVTDAAAVAGAERAGIARPARRDATKPAAQARAGRAGAHGAAPGPAGPQPVPGNSVRPPNTHGPTATP